MALSACPVCLSHPASRQATDRRVPYRSSPSAPAARPSTTAPTSRSDPPLPPLAAPTAPLIQMYPSVWRSRRSLAPHRVSAPAAVRAVDLAAGRAAGQAVGREIVD